MNRHLPCAALAAFLAAACGSPPAPPRRAAPAGAAAAKPVTDDEVRPVALANIYVYSPIGKRDPFQNTSVASVGIGRVEIRGRTKTPLEKWPLDALKLSMTVTGTASPLAMVEDPDHRGWALRLGDFIGQNGGKVTGIRRDEIVVTETITDHSTGRVYPQNVKLSVPVTKEEERDLNALQEGEHLGVARGER
ncbi:MAG TPA: pilus assembly protein PilP [Myxococcales bacterium]|nr:pilus assembly protein PilP [Myxococcales bacterium]